MKQRDEWPERSMIAQALKAELPWLKLLPNRKRESCMADLSGCFDACIEQGDFAAFRESLQSWGFWATGYFERAEVMRKIVAAQIEAAIADDPFVNLTDRAYSFVAHAGPEVEAIRQEMQDTDRNL